MSKRLLALCLLGSVLSGCGGGGGAETETVLYVTVSSPSALAGVRRLRVAVSNGTDTATLQYPEAAAAPADIALPSSFTVGLTKSRMGAVALIVDALGSDGTSVLASGSASVDMPVAGQRNDVAVTLTVPGFLLTVVKAGSGTGKVTSVPVGIDCGVACSANYTSGLMVMLFAQADSGSALSAWSGGCTADPCVVTMNMAKTVTATFEVGEPLDVVLDGTGKGNVTSVPTGIACGTAAGACNTGFLKDTTVTLTAAEDAASTFTGWSGDCAAAGTMKTCNLTMGGPRSVHASFTIVTNPLTVSKAGTGMGTVASNPAGINCGATCTADFAKNNIVMLHAQPQAGSYFAFWQGACTGSFHNCSVTMDAAKTVTAAFFLQDFNTAFVTSSKFTGADIGGLAGARTKCMQAAQASGLTGTYQPWLSVAGTDAGPALGTARGFVRLDAKPFADDVASMLNRNQIWNPLRIDENGSDVGDDQVWTGTLPNGMVAAGKTCGDWTNTTGTGIAGRALGGPVTWTNENTFACSDQKRLYCFMTDRNGTALIPPSGGGKIVFLSTTDYIPSHGAPDTVCVGDALANGLPGTYKALLANTASPASAILATATGYLRSDSIFVGTGAELSTSQPIRSGIWQFADKTYPSTVVHVWTGSTSPGVAGDAASTCVNWTATTGTGQIGAASSAGPTWWRDTTQPCTSPAKLYCAQQ